MADPDVALAVDLLHARASGQVLAAPTGAHALSPDRAYRVQRALTALRLERGERIVGWKLGYTSLAMREQMGISEPNFGPLTDAMMLAGGESVPPSVIQPKVEPEIALVLGSDVPQALSADRIAGHVAEARAALEVVDSIWRDYRFSWADNTADGSSAAHVVVGSALPVADLAAREVSLRRNGADVGSGHGANAMGDPMAALAWLSERLSGAPRGLQAGDVVITGGLCAAIDLKPGDVVTASFGDIDVTVRRDG